MSVVERRQSAASDPNGKEWIEGGSNKPLALDDAGGVFVVRRGHFDVFAVGRGSVASRRHHLFRAECGDALFGIEMAGHRHSLLAIGSIGSAVEMAPSGETFATAVLEKWILQLTRAAMTEQLQLPDRIAAAGMATLPAGARLSADPYKVHWVAVATGTLDFLGEVPVEASSRIPLAGQGWIAARNDGTLSIAPFEGCEPRELASFNGIALSAVTRLIERWEIEEQTASESARGASRQEFDAAIERLAGSARRRVGARPGMVSTDALETALTAVLSAIAVSNEDIVSARSILAAGRAKPVQERLEHALNALRIGRRKVMLQEDFWQTQGPAMLAWRGDARTPVGLIFQPHRGWEIADATGVAKLEPTVASDLAQDAVQLYPTLPARPLMFRDFLAFGAVGVQADLVRLGTASLLSAILALAVPFGSFFLFDSVIPEGRLSMFGIVVGALVIAALSASMFGLLKSIAVLRAEALFETRLQPALFERLIRLPISFFRAHTVGDIADRALGIQRAREIFAGSVVGGALSGVFGMMSLLPLFFYDSRLALVGVGLAALLAFVVLGLSYGQLRHERERIRHQGKLDGFVVQMLVGIGKLRAAAAEPRAMAQWTNYFVAQRDRFVSAQSWAAAQTVVMSALPTLAIAALFAMMAYWLKTDLMAAAANPKGGPPSLFSAADFIAFTSSFGQVTAALVGMASALTTALTAVPLVERAQPLIASAIEVAKGAEPPGVLTGDIQFKHVKFRYVPGGPIVLDDVSIHIEPGQFVALVGPSGSGKSTIGRLMLGFERPELGEILFGGKSSERIDMAALRRQVGVVLQHGRISGGTIYENIVGDAPLSFDEAWEVAKLVGLDQDIRDMPMGMHTVLLDGGATLSGGQRQRILIARALVRRPRILLLDEATSALDNRTQSIVTETLGKLSITRVVIAHRLTTIQSVDRIFVMERGRLIETGTYEELMKKDAAFATLTKRQML